MRRALYFGTNGCPGHQDYAVGFILGGIWYLLSNIRFSKVKVDYSIEAKNNYKKNMPGEFAVYVRSGLFSKWIEYQTYADRNFAESDAEKLSKNLKLPKYF